jgi:hypothetical protein
VPDISRDALPPAPKEKKRTGERREIWALALELSESLELYVESMEVSRFL